MKKAVGVIAAVLFVVAMGMTFVGAFTDGTLKIVAFILEWALFVAAALFNAIGFIANRTQQ